MSTPAEPRQLTARIRSVPGVVQMFPPSPAPSLLSAAGAGTPNTDQSVCVEVKETPSGTRITAKIAAAPDQPAPETARQVADALLDGAAPGTTVDVQIAHIA